MLTAIKNIHLAYMLPWSSYSSLFASLEDNRNPRLVYGWEARRLGGLEAWRLGDLEAWRLGDLEDN